MPTSDRFQKNLERWALFCPNEAPKLAALDDSAVTIADGVLRINDGNHSYVCEDPQAEAKQSLKQANLQEAKILYVYGLGGGQVYEALRGWLKESPYHQVVILEPDLRVIKKMLDTDICTDILFDRQCWLFFLDQGTNAIEHVTTLFVMQPWALIVPPSYEQRDSTQLKHLRAQLAFLSNLKYQALFEYIRSGYGFFQNFFRNMLQLPNAKAASEMYGRFHNIPAIICGAGPSLQKNLHLLEGLKDRAIIFAGGTAMNAVNADGFVPHFGVGIDPNTDQFTRLITNIAFETPFLYRNRMLHSGLNLVHGEHVYVPGSGGYGITKWMEEKLGLHAKDIPEGCNVINFSLSIAAEMGCNPIIFVGVDLAYSDEQSYASGIVNHPIHKRRDHFKTKNADEELIAKTDINGKGIYTLWKWVMESFWFSTFATHNPSLKLINSTEGGLGFINIPNIPLKEVAEKYLTEHYDIAGLVHTETQRAQLPETVTRENINKIMDEINSSLEKCGEYLASIDEEIEEMVAQQQGISSEDMLPAHVKDLIAQLEKEDAYINFLKVFNDAFSKYTFVEKVRLSVDKSLLEPGKIEEHNLSNVSRRYKFLAHTVQSNLQHLKAAAADAHNLSDLMASLASEYTPPKPPTVEEGTTSIDVSGKDVEKRSHKDKSGNVQAEYYLRNGRLHGPFTHFDNTGNIIAKTCFDNGARIGKSLYYYPSGNPAAILSYNNNKPEGTHRFYYSDGTLKAELNYSAGKLHGPIKQFDRFGRLSRELAFANGKRHGIERIWNEEGLLFIEAEYHEDIPCGRARKWYNNGNLALEIIYDPPGVEVSTRRWDVGGAIHAEEENEQDDYFDQVTRQTDVLTASLDQVVSQVSAVVPVLAQSIGGDNTKDDFQAIQKDLAALQQEMSKLKNFNQQLIQEAGLDPAHPKEPLWKSPSSRRELEQQVEEKTKVMADGLNNVHESFAKTLEGILKHFGKNVDDPPKPN